MNRIADGVIEHLAACELELRDQVATLVIERDTYREMAKAAVEQLHDQHLEIERQRRQVAHLIEENRRLRDAEAA